MWNYIRDIIGGIKWDIRGSDYSSYVVFALGGFLKLGVPFKGSTGVI